MNFGSFRELVEYIGNAHERYLLKERNIAEDVQYILRICSQVIHGILQLAAKAVWQRGYSDSGCMLIMGRASAGRSQQLVCEYRDW